jgi:hypothetical protein
VRSRTAIYGLLLLLSINAYPSRPEEKNLLQVKGQYLAYSYDHNQIFGEGVEFSTPSVCGTSLNIKVDVTSLTCYVGGNVVLKKDGAEHLGDGFYFDIKTGRGILIQYKDKIESTIIGDEKEEGITLDKGVLDDINLGKLRESLICFTGQEIEISENSEVFGTRMTLYLEGVESIGFKKMKMSEGIKQRTGGFSLDKVWYTNSQGLITRGSFLYRKKDKIQSLTQINYEERAFLKDYQGLERQFDLMTSTSVNRGDQLRLGMTGNYNSSGLWNSLLWLSRNWRQNFSTQFDFSYNKQINLEGEAWFGLQTMYNAGKYGSLSFLGRYELQNQIQARFSYGVGFLKNFEFLATSAYSRLKMAWEDLYTEILSSDVSLSYSSHVFNLATDYYLNYDLFGNQLLSQPQLRMAINPFKFYQGLLMLNLSNLFIHNNFRGNGLSERSYSNNAAVYLQTQPLPVWRSFQLNLTLAVEQFLEKEGRNFTSGGAIFQASQELWRGVSVQAFYSAQSRRKTKSWLIEGTTSQDLSLMLRISPAESLNGWVSFSYDPKNSVWRYSFADIAVEILKNWKLHSLVSYDFMFKKLENIDLYLIREAGRFQLRLIWRSISRQFLLELIPR